ncbi:MAG: DUF4129 domain-containing protein [Acidobacteriaceae bacterium]|nr:DUF4129 domain-containing protein [Acidobacteriaceae bacterium]
MKESAFASAVRLLEDALVLAARMDSTSWLVYLSGVLPFFAFLLYEWTSLAQSPFALERLTVSAFLLAVLYCWLHVCQSVFCVRLNAALTETAAPLRASFAQALTLQPALAPTKLIAWPAALALLVPHAAATMFYQASLLPPASDASWRPALAEARRDALYRPGQAVWLLLLTLLLRIIVWVNLFVLLVSLPPLWKTFTGQEGKFTRSPDLLLNPASFAALSILAYIALDPIVKAAAVLRRFARQSETSGLDLRLRLSLLRRAAAALLLCALFVSGPPMRARPITPPAVASPTTVSPDRMREAINRVFHDPRNNWDLPIVEPRKPAAGPIGAFIDSLVDHLGKAWDSVLSAIDSLLEALRHALSNSDRSAGERPRPVTSLDGWFVIGLFTLLIAALLFLAFRNRRKRARPQAAAGVALPARPIDIASEEVHAIDRPEAEWLALAARHRASGNLRLALRALYLSTLTALGRAGLISLARGKTNHDYLRELQRRAKRMSTDLIPAFRSNLGLFEQSWYGAHPVTEQTIEQFERNSSLLRNLS